MVVYGPAIHLQKKPILEKNHLFRWSSFWFWRVCKQAKLSHLRHRKPTGIHWKPDAPRTSHCLVRTRDIIRPFFFENEQGEAVNSQWRLSSGHVERIFHHKNWRGGCWQHLISTGRAMCHAAEATLDVLRPLFEDCIISRSESSNLSPLDYYFCGVPSKISQRQLTL